MEKVSWRFIHTPPLSAAENMATDDLLSRHLIIHKRPFLRLYSWKTTTVSFGRFQETSTSDQHASVEYVRRMTGGGAILHDHEITYSLGCMLHQIPDVDSISASYRRLTAFILQYYTTLGLTPFYAEDYLPDHFSTRSKVNKSFNCFEAFERADILIAGKKIGGNAQYRKRAAVLQHGSIPLSIDRSLCTSLLGSSLEKSVSLADCGIQTSVNEAARMLAQSFAESLDIAFFEQPLTEDEINEIEYITHTKYENGEWTWNRKPPRESPRG